MTMPAVVLTAERKIALEERPRPALRPDQVIVEVELCGICEAICTQHNCRRSTSATASWDTNRPADCRRRHRRGELEHRSTSRGQPQRKRLRGLRILQIGAAQLLSSGHPRNGTGSASQRRTRAADSSISVPPAGHPTRNVRTDAAWVEPAATALRAVEQAGDLRGRTVLVTGGGPIGQLACRLAYLKAPRRVLLMEPAADRAAFAPKSHATVITAEEAADANVTVDVAIECSGNQSLRRPR